MDRDIKIIELRPVLPLENSNAKPIELFQNETLRPILKLQHDFTFTLFQNHQNYKSKQNEDISRLQYEKLTMTFIQKNIDLKNQLIGSIVGLFTMSELEYYISQRKELNKRIIQMQSKRFVDTTYKEIEPRH